MRLSVFIVEDDLAVRDAMTILFRSQGIPTRSFVSGEDFFQHLPDDLMACVITDLRMPGMDGREVVRRLAHLRPELWPVIVLTGHADVPATVELMKAGVIEFFEKPVDPDQLISAVKSCLKELPQIAETSRKRRNYAEKLAALSWRERQVLEGVVAGMTNKQIANKLEISSRTVDIYRRNMMEKMCTDTLADLVKAHFDS